MRLRLTAVYGALFLLSGAALLAITYFLVSSQLPKGGAVGQERQALTGPAAIQPGAELPGGAQKKSFFISAGTTGCHLTTGPGLSTSQVAVQAQRCLGEQRSAELSQLLTESGVALGIMLMVSIGLGWLVAGRVLRKLRTITAAARSISASSLYARLALDGPDDELKELGDTFDGLLGRLDAAFGAQRQFVANASHELRTPLARQRTLIEVALADPEPSVRGLTDVCERVLATGEQQERLIEALLTLARSQRGLDRREPIDLAALTAEIVLTRQPEAELRGLTLATSFAPAPVLGDGRLAERLVANLLDNAIRHNVAHGIVRVSTGTWAGHAVLSVSNTGPVIHPDHARPAVSAVPAWRRRPHGQPRWPRPRAVDRRCHRRGAWRLAPGERADRRRPGDSGRLPTSSVAIAPRPAPVGPVRPLPRSSSRPPLTTTPAQHPPGPRR